MPRKTAEWTAIEKIKFAIKWENIRIAYFKQKRDDKKVDELIAKIKFLEVELTIAGYH